MRAFRLGLLALLTAYPLVVVGAATRGGVGISQDSVSYLAAAEALSRGDGLMTFTGEPLTLFPPGLPGLLAAAEALGVSATSAALALNLACLAAVVLGTYALAMAALGRPWPALASAGAVSLSTTFIGSFAWMWTEPSFTAVAVLLLIVLVRAIRRGAASWWVVVAAASLVWAATSLRYVGIVLIPVAGLGVWLSTARQERPQGAVRTAAVVVAASIVPAVIAVRNVSLGSGPLGERFPGTRTMEGALEDLVTVLGGFVFPPESTLLGALVGTTVVAALALGMWLAVIRRDNALVLLGAFVLVYGVAMIWSQSATRLDAPSARLLAPALPAMAVLAVYATISLLVVLSDQVRRWARTSASATVRGGATTISRAVPAVLLSVVLGAAVVASAMSSLRLGRDGPVGSLTSVVAASPLAKALSAIPGEPGIATNDPWSVYLATRRTPALPLPPSRTEWPETRVVADAEALAEAVRAGRVSYAAVFDDAGAVEPIARLVDWGVVAVPVAEFADGTLYRLDEGG